MVAMPACCALRGDAISYAKEKKVAMIPVDRNITGVKGCETVGPQLGSDFVEQGRRAADAMIKATGGTAKLAILLGASGVNVTDDRTAGSHPEVNAIYAENDEMGLGALAALEAYVNGDGAPAVTITTDNQYDKSNAAEALSSGKAY